MAVNASPLAVFPLVVLLLAIVGLVPSRAGAEGWQVRLSTAPEGPTEFLAVDKSQQGLFVFERQSPLAVVDKAVCTTGEKVGDKREEGDLKTPEGVYFIGNRLDAGLDYDLYGGLAFTLNFPNPVDRVKGKTGSGIWIHGRGHKITPRETKGCVALNNEDLTRLEPRLRANLPVLIAGEVAWTNAEGQSEVPANLARQVEAWAKAWGSKSKEFFEYFDPVRFAKSEGHPFEAFRSHKEGLFANLPWLQVQVSDVTVLPGPDYWVTYFGQYYRSPTLRSEGIKRLYWQADDQGRLRIVGNEWIEASLGLEQRYVEHVSRDMAALVEAWRKAWEHSDLESYLSYYDTQAEQDARRGLDGIRAHKAELWRKSRPLRVGIDNFEVQLHPRGLQIQFDQHYQAANGYKDMGHKTLLLEPQGDRWRIVSETWSAS